MDCNSNLHISLSTPPELSLRDLARSHVAMPRLGHPVGTADPHAVSTADTRPVSTANAHTVSAADAQRGLNTPHSVMYTVRVAA